MTVFAEQTTTIGTMMMETKWTIVEMTCTTIEMGNDMRIDAPQIIEVGKPNHERTMMIGSLATTVRRRRTLTTT